MFFGTTAAYDIVNTTFLVPYEYQMLDIIKYILKHLNEDKLPNVEVDMNDEKNEFLGSVEYSPEEIKKLLIEKGEQQIPIPRKGSIPKKDCKIVTSERVPYGMGETIQKIIDENSSTE